MHKTNDTKIVLQNIAEGGKKQINTGRVSCSEENSSKYLKKWQKNARLSLENGVAKENKQK